jgi:predicted small secreted protein
VATDYISGDKILWSYNAKETVSEDYDDKGSLVSTEKTTTTHNSFGHMVRKESITTLANGEKKVDTEERTYDMDGARVLKTVVTEDGKKQTTTYSY